MSTVKKAEEGSEAEETGGGAALDNDQRRAGAEEHLTLDPEGGGQSSRHPTDGARGPRSARGSLCGRLAWRTRHPHGTGGRGQRAKEGTSSDTILENLEQETVMSDNVRKEGR